MVMQQMYRSPARTMRQERRLGGFQDEPRVFASLPFQAGRGWACSSLPALAKAVPLLSLLLISDDEEDNRYVVSHTQCFVQFQSRQVEWKCYSLLVLRQLVERALESSWVTALLYEIRRSHGKSGSSGALQCNNQPSGHGISYEEPPAFLNNTSDLPIPNGLAIKLSRLTRHHQALIPLANVEMFPRVGHPSSLIGDSDTIVPKLNSTLYNQYHTYFRSTFILFPSPGVERLQWNSVAVALTMGSSREIPAWVLQSISGVC